MQIAKKKSFITNQFQFPLEYHNDGLIFCLDGEYNLGKKHGDCSNYVVDLINGIKLYPYPGSTINYTDKYFSAPDNNGLRTEYGENNQEVIDNALNFINLDTTVKTIEVVARERTASNWAVFYEFIYYNQSDKSKWYWNFANEEVSKAFYRYGERSYQSMNDYLPVGLYQSSNINKICSTSILRQNYNLVYKYINGIKNTNTNTNNLRVLPDAFLPNYISRIIIGTGNIDIFSIRVYNKILTDDIVKYNYNIDFKRFMS